jgi:hypothetical protein
MKLGTTILAPAKIRLKESNFVSLTVYLYEFSLVSARPESMHAELLLTGFCPDTHDRL